ncbi:MAG: Dolichyl-phosphate-mannose-protein mannosyltransferase [Gemmatimonadota bacterium]
MTRPASPPAAPHAASRRPWQSVWLMVAVGALLRVLLLLTWEGTGETDGIGRTMTAADWMRGATPLFGWHTWPELNFLLPALGIAVGGDWFWAPRVVYGLVSLALIPPVVAVTRRMGDEASAAVAGWLAAVTPFLAVFATSGARSETVGATGIMLALWGILRWDHGRGRWGDLLLAAAGVVVAEGVRFDGVLVGAALGVVLLGTWLTDRRDPLGGRRLVGMLLFGGVCLAYPVALSVSWHAHFGDPLHFLHTAQENARQFLVDGEHARFPTGVYQAYGVAFPLLATGFILTPVVTLLGLAGIAHRWRERAVIPLAALVAVQVGFIIKNIVQFTQQPQIRYMVPVAVLLLPGVLPGVRWVATRQWLPAAWRSPRRVAGAALLGALASEGLAALVTVRPTGLLTRQLGGYGPVQVDQFATRALWPAVRARAAAGDTLLVTPFVLSPYAQLATAYRTGGVPVVHPSNYQSGNGVYTIPDFEAMLAARLHGARFVLANTGEAIKGFVGGLARDPIGLAAGAAGDGLVRWGGHRFRRLDAHGAIVLLERLPDSASAAGPTR